MLSRVITKVHRKNTTGINSKPRLQQIQGCRSETPKDTAAPTAVPNSLFNTSVPGRLRSSRRHPRERIRSPPGRRDRSLPSRRGATRNVSRPGPQPRPTRAAVRRARVPALPEVRDLRPRIPARSLRRLRLRPARALFLLSRPRDDEESGGAGLSCTGSGQGSTPDIFLPVSQAISRSSTWKTPRRRFGGKAASMVFSFSVGSARR